MALTLAPYNNAMRLGMGFNSYTQQLCVNDAVVKANNTKAQDRDLKVRNLLGEPSGGDSSTGNDKSVVPTEGDGRKTNTVERTVGGVSQTVTWSTKFVDSLSQITNSMNISGSLEIKYSSVGGKGAGSFVDSNKFKESDLAFHLQVKVINQVLECEDVTEFNPIKDLNANEFTDVFGDSFISGFISGGEFNALVCYKVKDKSKLREIKASAEINFDKVPGLTVNAQGKAELTEAEKNAVSETNVSVSWSGGGEIKGADVKEWTVKDLKAVAIEFPDKVAKFPQRTHAILTKYATLRSYQVQKNKGSPLDYENAGVYTSALLDAYTDYKYLSSAISESILNVQTNGHQIFPREKMEELQHYRQDVFKDYQDKAVSYLYEVSRQAKDGATRALDLIDKHTQLDPNEISRMGIIKVTDVNERVRELRPPNSPNPVEVYAPTLLGLERARQHCRLEMIKIVQEVDAVALDPQIAVDATRTWYVFLPPVVFKMLVPTSGPPPEPTPEQLEIEALVAELEKKEGEYNSALEKVREEHQLEEAEWQSTIKKKDEEMKVLEETNAGLRPDADKERKRRREQELEEERKRIEKEETLKKNQTDEVNKLIDDAKKKAEESKKRVEELTKKSEMAKAKAAKAAEELEAAKTSIANLTKDNNKNSEDLALARTHEADLEKKLKSLTEHETEVTKKLQSAEKDQKEKNTKITSLEGKLTRAKADYDKVQKQLEDLQNTATMVGRLPLKVCQFGSLRLPELLLAEVADFEQWSTNWRLGFIGGNMKIAEKQEGAPVFNFGGTVDGKALMWSRHQFIPTKIQIWVVHQAIGGIKVQYANDKSISIGRCDVGSSSSLVLSANERVTSYEVQGNHTKDFGTSMATYLKLRTNKGAVKTWEAESRFAEDKNTWAEVAPSGFSLRGFWGQAGYALDRLGVVWASDT
ncbi:hypothetical protein F5Y18DRAFT_165340 [Xylariaceae sp. FL1019]|nr:hypothetical protein F5Y18DRAFT_165340 [Xylariaceae sp. FL1019]